MHKNSEKKPEKQKKIILCIQCARIWHTLTLSLHCPKDKNKANNSKNSIQL